MDSKKKRKMNKKERPNLKKVHEFGKVRKFLKFS